MSDLKNLYDRVLTAQADIEGVKNEINDALALGTPEGEEQALALELKLDETIANEAKWLSLYNKLSSANENSGKLKNFLHVSVEEIPVEDEEKTKGIINRAEFDALNAAEKDDFVRAGGKVTDNKE
jgi:hypothetical protein